MVISLRGPRYGKGALGCLFSVFVAAALGYFGLHIGEAYLRSMRFQDAMKGEIKFGADHSDAEIKERLITIADSLDLPDDAHEIGIARSGQNLSIWSDYTELLELPFHGQRIPFHPHAEGRVGSKDSSQ